MLTSKENKIVSTNTEVSSFTYAVNPLNQRTSVQSTGTAFKSAPAMVAIISSLPATPSTPCQHRRRRGMGMAHWNDRDKLAPETGLPNPVSPAGAGVGVGVDAPAPMISTGRDGCPQPSGRMDSPWLTQLPSASPRPAMGGMETKRPVGVWRFFARSAHPDFQ